MAAAAAAAAAYGGGGSKRQLLLRRPCVTLCRLLVVELVLVLIGDAAAADARTCSPPTQVALDQAQTVQLQVEGFRRWGEAPPMAAASGRWPASNKEKQTAGGRRLLVGSRAPTTCTYNECRGCRHRCSVQEVPIDASDPINSAYHYKCICHL